MSLTLRTRTQSLLGLKALNMDYLEAGNKPMLDIQELEELQRDAYENGIIYKERTKA